MGTVMATATGTMKTRVGTATMGIMATMIGAATMTAVIITGAATRMPFAIGIATTTITIGCLPD